MRTGTEESNTCPHNCPHDFTVPMIDVFFMAIPVTNIPVLMGEVAERFIEQCEYNSKYLAGSEWS